MKTIIRLVLIGAVVFAGYKAYRFIRIRQSIKSKLSD